MEWIVVIALAALVGAFYFVVRDISLHGHALGFVPHPNLRAAEVDRQSAMNGWAKFETLCKSLAALSVVCVPIVLGYIANEYAESIKNRELEGRFVGMAVQILRANPSDENKDLTEWAIKVIDGYSGVPLSLKAREGLVKSIRITGPLTTDLHCSKYLQHGRELLRVEEVQGGIDYLKKAVECQSASGR